MLNYNIIYFEQTYKKYCFMTGLNKIFAMVFHRKSKKSKSKKLLKIYTT